VTAQDPIVVEVGSAPITVTVASTGLVLSVATGTVGPAGAQGPAGSNGTNGQGVPTGGTTGQVLAKKSGTNYDTEWVAQSGGGGGGSVTSVTGTAPISVATGTTTPVVSIAAATTSAAGSMSASDKSKLDGVATGATANSSDATLLARANHTGTQVLSTISDAGTAAAKNAPATGNAAAGEVVLGSDTRLTDARTPSTTLSHASTHAAAGSDPVTVAQSQVTNLTTDLASKVPTTRTVATGNGLTGGGTLAADRTLAVSFGTTATTVMAGNSATADIEQFSNVNYTSNATRQTVIQQTGTLSAGRTVTLPYAGNLDYGSRVVVQAGAGCSATNYLQLNARGGETINGSSSLQITTAYGTRALYGDGVSAWYSDSGAVDGSQLTSGTVPSARLSTKAVGGQGAGSTVTEPTSLTSLLTSTVTLPTCAAGDVLLVDAGITFTQNNVGAKNYTFAVKLGATTMLSTVNTVSQSANARTAHLRAVIRVLTTTSQSGAISVVFNTNTAGSTGVATGATGTAAETISSALALDVLASTSAAGTTQTFQLQSLSVTKVAA